MVASKALFVSWRKRVPTSIFKTTAIKANQGRSGDQQNKQHLIIIMFPKILSGTP